MSRSNLTKPSVDIRALVSEYQDGAGGKTIGDKYGMSPGTVLKWLRKAGVTIRKTGGRSSKVIVTGLSEYLVENPIVEEE